MSQTTLSPTQKGKAIKLIQMIARTYKVDIMDILFGTVKAGSYDSTSRTITVIPITGNSDTEITGVLLQADSGDGELKVPSDGTTVAMCHSLLVDPFVICGQDYDSIMWKGGNFGGLCKTLELQTQINKLNAQLQAVISSLQNWTVAPTDGGAALKAFFATQILGKAAGDFSNIENQKIIHGDK
jgi:hypothetical protein